MQAKFKEITSKKGSAAHFCAALSFSNIGKEKFNKSVKPLRK